MARRVSIGLGYDSLVDWIAISTLAFTVIGAMGAVAAAWFGLKAPTRSDIERVERNTAESARHIDAVRAHMAEQGEREAMLVLVNRISITVQARGPVIEPLQLDFELNDVGVELRKVDLINGQQMLYGSFVCVAADPSHFVATIDPNTVRNWASGCGNPGPLIRVQVRAYLYLNGKEVKRVFSVDLSRGQQPIGDNARTFQPIWLLSGRC